ncbi:MAG: hypothetical protein ACRYFR_14655 [Janthinobacterium lividum]
MTVPFRLFSALLLGPLLAFAQAPPPAAPLPRLLAERQVLTRRYAAARAQRNSLFGLSDKPSKKDLQAVVDALQGIVNKDEQIVAVLNQTAQAAQNAAATLQATGRNDRNLTADHLAEIQNKQLNVQERERRAMARQLALEDDLDEAQQARQWRDWAIAGLALACVGLLAWGRQRRR